MQQSTRPQTLGYALADSPAGQAAWIYEKFHEWSDNGGSPEDTITLDEMLDNIMLYWLTNSGVSSARIYWEGASSAIHAVDLYLPVGCSIFPKEIYTAPRGACTISSTGTNCRAAGISRRWSSPPCLWRSCASASD
jgi:hypothetical protein